MTTTRSHGICKKQLSNFLVPESAGLSHISGILEMLLYRFTYPGGFAENSGGLNRRVIYEMSHIDSYSQVLPAQPFQNIATRYSR